MDPKVPTKKAVVETFANDMAGVIENDHEGLIKKIISEEEAHESEKKNLSPESRRNKILIFWSAILIIISLSVLGYFLGSREPVSVEVERAGTPLLFTERTSFIEVVGMKRQDIINSVVNRRKLGAGKAGGVESIYLTLNKEVVGLRQFLELTKSSFVPGEPLLVSDNFLMGAVNSADDGSGFFFLLKARTTSDIFEALRAWEGKMFYDLYEFFDIAVGRSNNYLLTKLFEDGIVENKNARLLYDDQGKLILAYVFADNNSVLITDSLSAAREAMLRLQGKRTQE